MNINPFEKSPTEDNEEENLSETSEESTSPSREVAPDGVGEHQEQYTANEDSAAKNLTPLRDALDESAIAKLEKMKKERESSDDLDEKNAT